MRRVWATLLVSLFSFMLIAPALLAVDDAESSLPACCRRNGQHRCSMLKDHAGQGQELQSARCPDFPSSHGFPAGRSAAALHTPHGALAPQVADSSARPQTEARYHVSYNRSRQKRGPPSLS